MRFNIENLRKDEQIPFLLEQLYSQFGYKKFRMEKFEEYDFYLENKSFLRGEHIITFPGLDGKLMALKPDITLSILKNTPATALVPDKRFYTENVYRVSKASHEIREIPQTGLEYVGKVDMYVMCEVLSLAMRTLDCISANHLLSVAHVGFLTALFEAAGLPLHSHGMLKFLAQKNARSIKLYCNEKNVSEDFAEKFIALSSASSLDELKNIVCSEKMQRAYLEMEQLYTLLSNSGFENKLYIDFSIINDTEYYNGLVFSGFIEGIPHSVLSGGRYDGLLTKMNKNDLQAIGFAVYFDSIERFLGKLKNKNADIAVIYNEKSNLSLLFETVNKLYAEGKSFNVQTSTKTNAKTLFYIKEDSVEVTENA